VTDSQPKATELTPDQPQSPAPPEAPPPVVERTGSVPVSPPAQPAPPPAAASGIYWGTGRRKSAVARVRLLPGSGRTLINGREIESYFSEPQDRLDVVAPLELTGVRRHWDVLVNVRGGGHTGQAGAIRLGLARALVKAYNQFEATLREAGYLTRDARRVERKKPGRRKARRRFQFSKR